MLPASVLREARVPALGIGMEVLSAEVFLCLCAHAHAHGAWAEGRGRAGIAHGVQACVGVWTCETCGCPPLYNCITHYILFIYIIYTLYL